MSFSYEEKQEIVSVEFDRLLRVLDASFLILKEGEEYFVGRSVTENEDELLEDADRPLDEREVDTIEVPRWLALDNMWAEGED